MNSNSDNSIINLRVAVADHSPFVSEGLMSMFSDEFDIHPIARFCPADQIVKTVETINPHALLVGMDMGGDIMALLRLIKRVERPPAVIVLADYPSRVLEARCLQAGADLVFTRTTDINVLADALRQLAVPTEPEGSKSS